MIGCPLSKEKEPYHFIPEMKEERAGSMIPALSSCLELVNHRMHSSILA